VADFDTAARIAFVAATASSLGVAPSQVSVTSVGAGSVVVEARITHLASEDHAREVTSKAAHPSLLAASLVKLGLGSCKVEQPAVVSKAEDDEANRKADFAETKARKIKNMNRVLKRLAHYRLILAMSRWQLGGLRSALVTAKENSSQHAQEIVEKEESRDKVFTSMLGSISEEHDRHIEKLGDEHKEQIENMLRLQQVQEVQRISAQRDTIMRRVLKRLLFSRLAWGFNHWKLRSVQAALDLAKVETTKSTDALVENEESRDRMLSSLLSNIGSEHDSQILDLSKLHEQSLIKEDRRFRVEIITAAMRRARKLWALSRVATGMSRWRLVTRHAAWSETQNKARALSEATARLSRKKQSFAQFRRVLSFFSNSVLRRGWRSWLDFNAFNLAQQATRREALAYSTAKAEATSRTSHEAQVRSQQLRRMLCRMVYYRQALVWGTWSSALAGLLEEDRLTTHKARRMLRMLGRMLHYRRALVWGTWSSALADLLEEDRLTMHRALRTRRIVCHIAHLRLARCFAQWYSSARRANWKEARDYAWDLSEQFYRESLSRSQLRRILKKKLRTSLRMSWETWRSHFKRDTITFLKMDAEALRLRLARRAVYTKPLLRAWNRWVHWKIEKVRLQQQEDERRIKRLSALHRTVVKLCRGCVARALLEWQTQTLQNAREESSQYCRLVIGASREMLTDSLLRRIMRSFITSTLRKGWNKWRDFLSRHQLAAFKLGLAQKSLARLVAAGLFAAWQRWADFVKTSATERRVMIQMMRRVLRFREALVWRVWRSASDEKREMERTVERTMERTLVRVLRFRQAMIWRAWSLASDEAREMERTMERMLKELERIEDEKLAAVKRVIGRLVQSRLARCFAHWRYALRQAALEEAQAMALSHALTDAETWGRISQEVASQELNKTKIVTSLKIISRLAIASLVSAWNTWMAFVVKASSQEHMMTRVIARVLRAQESLPWLFWEKAVKVLRSRAASMRRVLSHFSNRHLSLSFTQWRDVLKLHAWEEAKAGALARLNARNLLSQKKTRVRWVLHGLLNSTLRKAWTSWIRVVRQLGLLSQKKRSVRWVLHGLLSSTLRKAWTSWIRVVRQLGLLSQKKRSVRWVLHGLLSSTLRKAWTSWIRVVRQLGPLASESGFLALENTIVLMKKAFNRKTQVQRAEIQATKDLCGELGTSVRNAYSAQALSESELGIQVLGLDFETNLVALEASHEDSYKTLYLKLDESRSALRAAQEQSEKLVATFQASTRIKYLAETNAKVAITDAVAVWSGTFERATKFATAKSLATPEANRYAALAAKKEKKNKSDSDSAKDGDWLSDPTLFKAPGKLPEESETLEGEESVRLYEEACQLYYEVKQSVEERGGLGWAHLEHEEQEAMDEVIRMWRKAASHSHFQARCNLGMLHANGHGVKQSHTEAAKLYLASESPISYDQK